MSQMVPVWIGIVVITFGLVHVLGDPTDLVGEGVDAAQVQVVRKQLGLDQPLWRQFVNYATGLARADLGRSYVSGRPVTALIRERAAPTLALMGTALAVSTLVGLAMGTRAARQPSGLFAMTTTAGTLVGYAVPGFWLAQILVLTVALPTGLFPVEGLTTARESYTGVARILDMAHHLLLPAIVLAVSELALVARLTRTGVAGQLGMSHVVAARARGLDESRVVTRHALPNALLPVVTVIGGRVGFLLSGAVLVESVFAWPGLGTLLIEAANGRDYPVVLGMVLLTSVSVLVANLATDLAYAWVDPRVRYR